MIDTQKKTVVRFAIVYVFILAFFVLVIFKITSIISEREQWLALQASGKKTEIEVKPKRGDIYASDGRLMASTVPTYYIYMDTKVPALRQKDGQLFKDNIDSVSIALAQFFKNKSSVQYKREITRAYENGNRRFKLFPERISYSQLKDLRQLPLFRLGRYKSGLIYEKFVHRVKPFGSLASRTIGDVYADESKGGKNGLELYFNNLLKGKPGKAVYQKYANTWQENILLESEDGMDIVTFIDVDVQDIAEKALLDALNKFTASEGCAILMETKTGKIQAIVNLQRNADGSYSENVNSAVSSLMEPGSTFKIASFMVALDEGKYSMTDSIDTGNGIYNFHGRKMRDHNAHKGGYKKITYEEAIQASSNVGVSRMIVDTYGHEPGKFVDALYKTKINQNLELEIPGAAKPYIKHPKDSNSYFSKLSLPWMSIGYELQMPPIYTLNFYNAIANGGKMIQPLFVKEIRHNGEIVKSYETKVINPSICKSSTLDDVQQAMWGVVWGKYATAKGAQSPYVSIAGKTGTAQISQGRKGYKGGGRASHVVSFCGYFPSENPKYTGIVVVRDPRWAYISSGMICGETLKNIAERTMAIKSDKNLVDKTQDTLFMLAKTRLPAVKSGNYEALQMVAKKTDLSLSGEANDWVKVQINENEIKIDPLVVEDKLIPDVRGMGAKDAVYLLEKDGLKVQMSGRGKVIKQSVTAGTKAIKGATVLLTLQ